MNGAVNIGTLFYHVEIGHFDNLLLFPWLVPCPWNAQSFLLILGDTESCLFSEDLHIATFYAVLWRTHRLVDDVALSVEQVDVPTRLNDCWWNV